MAAGGENVRLPPADMPSGSGLRCSEDFAKRPDFVDKEMLEREFACALCSEILLDPYQSPCGSRLCKDCLEGEFDGNDFIPCPLPHADFDADELAQEECQRLGLSFNSIKPDTACQRTLTRQKCYCPNKQDGCKETPPWSRLKRHEEMCQYKTVCCPQRGCRETFAKQQLPFHLDQCPLAEVCCQFCGETTVRQDIEVHLDNCELVEMECDQCHRQFNKPSKLKIHQSIHPPCVTTAGKCYYYNYCKYEAPTVDELCQHLSDNTDLHLQALTSKLSVLEQKETGCALSDGDVKKILNKKMKPLETVLGEVHMKATQLREQMDASESEESKLVDMMRKVNNSRYETDKLEEELKVVNRNLQHRNETVPLIKKTMEMVTKHDGLILKLEKDAADASVNVYDGLYIWKILNYKQYKKQAVDGTKSTILSRPFYTSRAGYKLTAQAYLNGYGAATGKFLSMYFTLRKGDYDPILPFPFKHHVNFTLLCPRDPSKSITKTFIPEGQPAVQKPQGRVVLAIGCTEFVPITQVESSDFLVENCIYVRIKVTSPPGAETTECHP